jgi:alkylation response protein AidB-like acyl-CoA dehydrogenase
MVCGMSAEQQQLAAAEKAWLSRHDPIARLRTQLDEAVPTIDPDAVAHAAESGLLGLLTPDIGGSHTDLAVVSETHGSAASSLPLADLAVGNWLITIADLPMQLPPPKASYSSAPPVDRSAPRLEAYWTCTVKAARYRWLPTWTVSSLSENTATVSMRR